MIFVKIKINHLFQQHSLFVSASAVVFSLSLFSSSHHLQGFHLPAIGTSSIAASGDSTRFSTCFPLGAFSFSLPHSWDCLTSTWFLNQLMEYWAIEMISIPKRKNPNIYFDWEIETNFVCLKSHSVTRNEGQKCCKMWMWNIVLHK